MLAIALSSVLVGVGGSRKLSIADLGISDLLHPAAAARRRRASASSPGSARSRQMDDKPGVPVLADLWARCAGRPLMPAEPLRPGGLFVVFEGGEGAGKSTQVAAARRARCAAQGRDVVVTREPGATEVGERIRGLVLDPTPATGEAPSPRAPRRCSTPPTGPITSPPWSGPRWPGAPW